MVLLRNLHLIFASLLHNDCDIEVSIHKGWDRNWLCKYSKIPYRFSCMEWHVFTLPKESFVVSFNLSLSCTEHGKENI